MFPGVCLYVFQDPIRSGTRLLPLCCVLHLPFYYHSSLCNLFTSTLSDFFFWKGDLNTVFLIQNFNSNFFVTWIQMYEVC